VSGYIQSQYNHKKETCHGNNWAYCRVTLSMCRQHQAVPVYR